MPMPKPSHTVEIEVDPGWGLSVKLICPWDPSDESRPCWPHLESGERDDMESALLIGCTYYDWVDDQGIEAFEGPALKMTLPTHISKWGDGGYPTFAIGQEPS